MFKRRFQRGLCWNQVKYARIAITHVWIIALTFAGSLGRCLNTRPNGLLFKQLPRDPANVYAWKNMCDPYIHKWEVALVLTLFAYLYYESICKPKPLKWTGSPTNTTKLHVHRWIVTLDRCNTYEYLICKPIFIICHAKVVRILTTRAIARAMVPLGPKP